MDISQLTNIYIYMCVCVCVCVCGNTVINMLMEYWECSWNTNVCQILPPPIKPLRIQNVLKYLQI